MINTILRIIALFWFVSAILYYVNKKPVEGILSMIVITLLCIWVEIREYAKKRWVDEE